MRRAYFLIALTMFWISPGRAQNEKPQGPKPARVEITPHVDEAQAGGQLTFAATGYDEAGNKMDAKPSAWFASPFDLASADDQGVVTFVQAGEVRIGALINGKAGSLTLNIKPRAVARIDIKAPAQPIPVGTGIPLTAVTRMATGDPRTDVQVKWSSLNTGISTVDEASGFVTGAAPGTVPSFTTTLARPLPSVTSTATGPELVAASVASDATRRAAGRAGSVA